MNNEHAVSKFDEEVARDMRPKNFMNDVVRDS